MRSIYYREQKHICGKDYDTAPYMEVDLLKVVAAQNMDYSSEEEIEERIAKAIEDGLEICKTF